MKEALSALKDYQEILNRKAFLEKQLSQIPPEIQQLETEWKELVSQGEQLEMDLENLKKEKHQAELNLTVQKEKNQKFEKDLSEVTNDKEYNAVLREIDSAKKEISKLESTIKDCGTSITETEAKIEETSKLSADSEKKYQGELETFRQGQSSGSNELEQLKSDEEAARAKVPKGILSKFNRIAERRNGMGLAFCQGSICKGCNVRVRHHIVEQLKTRDKVMQCESCRRILYYLESEEEA